MKAADGQGKRGAGGNTILVLINHSLQALDSLMVGNVKWGWISKKGLYSSQ